MPRKLTLLIVALVALSVTPLVAQETYFGKNKVTYEKFDWQYIQSRHFDVYFYKDGYETAKFAANVLESTYVEVAKELDYNLQRRVPVFIYNSHMDFQQTNITPEILSEGIGGFTEAFKNRIVVPFSGSYEDFRHVLHHELTHAVIYDLLFGNMFSALLSRQRLFDLPLWYAEGYAEYSSRHGWDYFADMFVRDATINNYLAPPDYLGGFLAYKQGQAMVKYIADKYGEDKLGTILQKGRVYLTMNRAFKEAIGVDLKKFWEDFSLEMKRRYWPEISERKKADEIGHQITRAREDGSYFNEQPTFTPDGTRVAIFTDRSDYTEIMLISATDGRKSERLVKSERSGDLESLHSFVSGMSFSPDGRSLVFAAKSDGKDALIFFDVRKKKTYLTKPLGLYNILSPAWSPDGTRIVFSGLKGPDRDLYVYTIATEQLVQLTSDKYDDLDPAWTPDSKNIVFASDRQHPGNPERGHGTMYVSSGAELPGDFKYGYLNLFTIKLDQNMISPLEVGPGENKSPRVSPDGKKIAFISNRNGIDNLYIKYTDSAACYAVTDILTGIRSYSWSPEGNKIAFSAFQKGAFDIFVMKDIAPVGDKGVLKPTDFILGKYDLLNKGNTHEQLAAASKHQAKPDSTKPADSAAQPTDSAALAVADSTKTDSTALAAKDSVITETGIYDGDFVFVGKEKEHAKDPLDSLMTDITKGNAASDSTVKPPTPTVFDSVPPRLANGEYEIKPYKTKFTPDIVGGGVGYDTFYGLRGQTYFLISDYLGNHQFYITTDLVNSLDQSFIQAFYFNSTRRTDFGAGLFHTKNFYLDDDDNLFSDRFYGLQGFLSYPFSMFSRVELTGSQMFIDREYLDSDDDRANRSSKVSTAELAYVTDNIIWGNTGPVNGTRARLSLSGGVNLFEKRDVEFSAAELDYRKYWHFAKTFSMAFRVAGGASFGSTPKLYFLGGTTNYIGDRTVDARVYEVENLYFSQVVTPLRGYDYYELSGTRFSVMNWEFRFPLIEYFAMRFPLPLVLAQVNGALFADVGAAWRGNDFKGVSNAGGKTRLQDIKSGFGFGMRANLGFLLLRYDMAWATDLYSVSDRPHYYFSFGADF